ncbi:MAG: TlpA family protein disulfide reductase [Betaproteobacteria bacterium]|nr:TlpA family protein disulfide reductase [Betaproteobacteria bacterium]
MRFVLLALAATFAASALAQELKPWTGGAAPPLALEDMEGRPHRLESYRGKVVLVNFWATWCEPCREEMPSIERLRRSMDGRPFAVLAVNLAEPVSRIRAFLEKMPVSFTVLLDRDTAVAKAWKARILPATYIVGPDGRIRYAHLGELDWSHESVRRAIAALLPP